MDRYALSVATPCATCKELSAYRRLRIWQDQLDLLYRRHAGPDLDEVVAEIQGRIETELDRLEGQRRG